MTIARWTTGLEATRGALEHSWNDLVDHTLEGLHLMLDSSLLRFGCVCYSLLAPTVTGICGGLVWCMASCEPCSIATGHVVLEAPGLSG